MSNVAPLYCYLCGKKMSWAANNWAVFTLPDTRKRDAHTRCIDRQRHDPAPVRENMYKEIQS